MTNGVKKEVKVNVAIKTFPMLLLAISVGLAFYFYELASPPDMGAVKLSVSESWERKWRPTRT